MKLAIIILILISSIIAISSTNIFILWASIELNILCFVPLILNKENAIEIEASINYFLAQALGSAILLIRGASLIRIHWFIKTTTILLSASILLKLGASPCFHWFPLVMEKIKWINCLLLSFWQKIIPLFITLFIILSKINNYLIIFLARLNFITGGAIILSQTSIKKIIAYSSITHTGWIISTSASNTLCLAVIYLITYSIIIAPLFTIFNKINILYLSSIWRKEKLSFNQVIIILIIILSLGGIPPLTGFIQKLLVVNILLNSNSILLIILVSGSLINLFFYLNIGLTISLYAQNDKILLLSTSNMPVITNTILAINTLIILTIIL